MKRRRLLLALAATLIVAGVGYWWWWWQSRLTAEEELFVRTWCRHEAYEGGSTCDRALTLRRNRTMHIHNVYHWVGDSTRPARNEVADLEWTWSCRNGRLVLIPDHPPLKKLHVFTWTTTRRIRNLVDGRKELVMDWEGSNGRLTQFDSKSFTVYWWHPEAQAESDPVTFVAVPSEDDR